MSNPKGFIITLIIIAFPIIWLVIQLNMINETYNTSGDEYKRTETETLINNVVEEEMNNSEVANIVADENNSGEETHASSIYGNPTSKLIEGAKINTDGAFVYSEPDDTLTPLTSFKKDMEVTVQDYENGWSNIKFNDVTGWIRTEYVTKPGEGSSLVTSAVGHKAIITVSSTLNVRDNADGNIIDAVSGGTEVSIIGANDDESWYQIQYGTKSGWISANPNFVRVTN